MEPKTIAIAATLDTKGAECAFVREQIERRGHRALVIDVGTGGAATIAADIPRESMREFGGRDAIESLAAADRGTAVEQMGRMAAMLVRHLFGQRRFDAVIGLGGSGGTSICTTVMKGLPIGVPKLMVSTVASGDVSAYVGEKDIVMMPAIVDLAGLNRISRRVLAQAAGAICGMVETEPPPAQEDKPLVVASMFGNTTKCVEAARRILEDAGYEVLVFHATGSGGRTMESLVESRMVAGVLDITTTELADELCGGVMSAGPSRLTAAERCGVPAVVVPGCLDMVNFWAPETVPDRYRGRKFYQHNPNVTLMRTDVEENRKLGLIMAGRLRDGNGPLTVLLPLRGLSVIGAPGGPFHWPEADQMLFTTIKQHLEPVIPVIEIDANINDEVFARRCAEALLENIEERNRRGTTKAAKSAKQ